MGDWAENRLSAALGQALPEWKVIQYGTTDRIAAGHPDFKKRYLAGLEETRRFGKRPDLLLFPTTDSIPTNLYERDHAGSEGFVKRAIAAVEVRSSKFEAHTGFPTRLLDWTRNPLVAAFFAVEHPGDHDRAVWVHHAEIPMLTFDLDGLARHITWMRLRHREG